MKKTTVEDRLRAKLRNLAKDYAARGKRITELEGALADCEHERVQLNARIAERERMVADYERDLQKAENAIRHRDYALEQVRAQYERVRVAFDALAAMASHQGPPPFFAVLPPISHYECKMPPRDVGETPRVSVQGNFKDALYTAGSDARGANRQLNEALGVIPGCKSQHRWPGV